MYEGLQMIYKKLDGNGIRHIKSKRKRITDWFRDHIKKRIILFRLFCENVAVLIVWRSPLRLFFCRRMLKELIIPTMVQPAHSTSAFGNLIMK